MGYIIKPLVTEKMTGISEKQNKFGFIVRPEANKIGYSRTEHRAHDLRFFIQEQGRTDIA